MPIRNDIAALRKKLSKIRGKYQKQSMRAVKAACQDMVIAAAEATPPLNGEDRGKNTVTGNLAAHWKYEINETPEETRVTLINDMQYASFVDQGHKLKEHFVPWLFIDGMGQLARDPDGHWEERDGWEFFIGPPNKPLYGLVVGTQTDYIDGYHMVDKAKERFVKALRAAHDNIMQGIGERIDGGD